MAKLRDLTGQKFNRLTVIERYTSCRSGRTKWLCRCDCGKEKPVLALHIVRGTTKSCGCARPCGKERADYKGYEGLSGQFWHQIVRGADGSKGRPPIPLNITIKDAWELFEAQEHRCALTGVEIYLPARWIDTGTASLDRIDSSRGYEPGNVQWVHKDVNRMKNSFDQSYFIKMCQAVADRQSSAIQNYADSA